MNKYLICNGVSAYKEAPVSIDILKNNTSQVLEAINLKKAEENYIVLDQKEKELQGKLEVEAKNYPDMNLKITLVDGSFGFIYRNSSAILKVIEGEKAIPTSKEVAMCEASRCLQCDLRLNLKAPKLWNEY